MTEDTQRQLGRIEGKQDAMCKSLTRIEKKLDALPCEAHTRDCVARADKRVTWKVFVLTISFLFTLICGAYTYTYQRGKIVKTIDTLGVDNVAEARMPWITER